MFGARKGLGRVASLVTLQYTSDQNSVLMRTYIYIILIIFVRVVYNSLLDLRKTKNKDRALEKKCWQLVGISSTYIIQKNALSLTQAPMENWGRRSLIDAAAACAVCHVKHNKMKSTVACVLLVHTGICISICFFSF